MDVCVVRQAEAASEKTGGAGDRLLATNLATADHANALNTDRHAPY